MRDTLFPPPSFFNSKHPATAATAHRVHQICNDAVWRSLGFGGKLHAGFLALAWPLSAAAISLYWVRRNAAAIRALTGKSVLSQFIEMWRIATRYRIAPKYYYMFELYLMEHMAQAGDYLMRFETKQVAYRLLRPKVTTTGTPIKDKIAFAAYCRDHKLRALPVIVAFRDGSRIAALEAQPLPEGDLFVKRVMGKGGAGAERWNWIGNGLYRSTRGPELAGPALLDHVADLSKKDQPYLVQPAVSNHAALRDLSLGALCTIRVLTCRDEHGGHEVTNASFRMAMNPKSPIDNFHAGGIAASVDLATGRLGPASDLGLGPNFVWHEQHPVTGAQIAGRILPFWHEAMALTVEAHAAFAEWVVIGWDVAILDDGPRLIEGNKGPDIDVIQRTLRAPIGGDRFGKLLAYNLEQVSP